MIFQDPMTSLSPVHRIGDQIVEQIRAHEDVSKAAARGPRRRADGEGRDPACPRPCPRLSARILRRHAPAGDDRDGAVLFPSVLIADEPTTALDVTIQAQILELRSSASAVATAA